ncbi:kinase binding protein CGI-121-domain-containing protein [Sporodiniella umbellata]|nr:kinase binding protein CGI-121-domain-containing protein [Sporodiniella umbellata]
MESYALELFPSQVHLGLFENVTNASELKQKLINQDAPLQCAFIDASFVLSPFHALLVAQRAVHEQSIQKLKTNNLYSQIIFDFSPQSNIAKALALFGIKETTTHVLAIRVGGTVEEAKQLMTDDIQGQWSSLDRLSSLQDLGAIKKAYQVPTEEKDLSNITSFVIGGIALKGH